MRLPNPAAFRMAASRFATGVAVITAFDEDGQICGMTANSFVTISLSLPTVLISVMPGRMHRAISTGKRYAVNVLPENAGALSTHFAGKPDPLLSLRYSVEDRLPRLSECIAFFACSVVREVEVHDHSLFIAEVTHCDHSDCAPLVFFRSQYHVGPGKPFAVSESSRTQSS